MRLGIPVRVLGRRGLRTYDARRPQNTPHLSVSLVHLHDVFRYLREAQITMYRMSSDLAPFATHPALPAFHDQIEQCVDQLAAMGALARQNDLRLSFHAPPHVQLGAEDAAIARQSCAALNLLATLLDAMELDGDAVIVVHVGGTYGAPDAAIGRWVARWEQLPERVQRRLALEHEDEGASLGTALRIHAATCVPLVFDYLHFQLNNPERWSIAEGVAVALATWPLQRTPKLHFSSPRTELRAITTHDPASGRQRWVLSPPRAGHHADFLNVWEFARLIEAARHDRDFDVMLEAKASDVALLRLRADLIRYMPELAPLVVPAHAVQRGA